ncbi:hypothetical protein [uncultured Phascolarctobacterium sp.]|nr:hypothetical protein [uncultured Phascolarctobacterium sp.]
MQRILRRAGEGFFLRSCQLSDGERTPENATPKQHPPSIGK